MAGRTVSSAWPRAFMRFDTNTALTSGVPLTIAWEAAQLDTHGMWNPATPTLLFPPISGFYVAVFGAAITTTGTIKLDVTRSSGIRDYTTTFTLIEAGMAVLTCPFEVSLGQNVSARVEARGVGLTLDTAVLWLYRQGI